MEADTYCALKLWERLGLIRGVRLQDPVSFMTYLGYGKVPKTERYKIDFQFFHVELNTRAWCEAKGLRTNRWIRCEKLWRLEGPGPLWVITSEHYARDGSIRLPIDPIWPNGRNDR